MQTPVCKHYMGLKDGLCVLLCDWLQENIGVMSPQTNRG